MDHERIYLRRLIGIVLAAVAALCLIVLGARYAYAEDVPLHVYERDGVTVKLMSGPCVEPMSLRFFSQAPQYIQRLRAIESTWRMQDGSYKPFPGCWMELSKAEAGAEVFFLIFSDGERFAIPKAEFTLRKGQVGA